MLERVVLKGFKAAADLSVRLEPLTLLTGLNSSGKSTVLQSIALLRQSFFGRGDRAITLHGSIVQLGTFGEILSEGRQADSIELEVRCDSQISRIVFSADSGSSYAPAVVMEGDWSCITKDDFQFLHADRISPQSLFPRSSEAAQAAGVLGARGEYTAEFLATASVAEFEVPQGRRATRAPGVSVDLSRKIAPTSGLLEQTAAWMQHLSPGVRLTSDLLAGTDSARILFEYVGRTGVLETDKKIRPGNVGFGLTYSLPIVVSCLIAPPGSLLLVENPEAHLHPQGQAAMGELLAKVAADGVQLVIETHSDHVLNAIRLAVKKGVISSDLIAIHYFTRDIETGFSVVESPAMLEDGRLSSWPSGFFDQWDMALDELLR